jgi:hypothetical protein
MTTSTTKTQHMPPKERMESSVATTMGMRARYPSLTANPRLVGFEFLWGILLAIGSIHSTQAFSVIHQHNVLPVCGRASSPYRVAQTLFMGKTRKAQKTRKVEQSRPKNFFDAIKDAQDETTPVVVKEKPIEDDDDKSDAALTSAELAQQQEREARAEAARRRMDQRPDVSTLLVDDETGVEILAQGKNVMDVVTRQAVQLSNRGADYRLAQMFPGVPPAVREAHRVDWNTISVPQLLERWRDAASVRLESGTRGVPPHPSLANTAIDFVLANRDYLGYRMKRTLGRVQMRALSLGQKQEAADWLALWKNFLTLENHVSAPFRQIHMDAEGRIGPNFGNLDVATYCKGDLYQRCANYLVLKGMVAHWEKKVVDADQTEKKPQTKDNYMTVLSMGDPRRFLPDPPILFTLRECAQVCAMSQQMTKAFVETPSLFDDLPVEVRFIEPALRVQGGTALRKFVVDEFCPRENITPAGLREGLRRLICQLDSMQIDPYADITNILQRLVTALSVGTDDERDPYAEYLTNKDLNGPGSFTTYTFNHEKLSLVRFLDAQYERSGAMGRDVPSSVANNGLPSFFNFGPPPKPSASFAPPVVSANDNDGDVYKVPKERAAGRPHNLGWLDLLNDGTEKDDSMKLGKIPPGRIIVE